MYDNGLVSAPVPKSKVLVPSTVPHLPSPFLKAPTLSKAEPTAGGHRTQSVQGHEASAVPPQLSGSRLLLPASSCGSSCAASSADCPRAEPSLLQPRSYRGPACSAQASRVGVGTSQVKFSSRVYNIYARRGITDKYPVTQLCCIHSNPIGAAAVSCQSLLSPREMTPSSDAARKMRHTGGERQVEALATWLTLSPGPRIGINSLSLSTTTLEAKVTEGPLSTWDS